VGGGVASRFKIGLVIASSLSVGTLLTLFVLPDVYLDRRPAARDRRRHGPNTSGA
jgi:NADH:ubiquinone oxidoreductase subunit H